MHDDASKPPIDLDDCKVDVAPKIIDDPIVTTAREISRKPRSKVKSRVSKPKAAVKRTSQLEKATACLYDLEGAHGPEKTLNIELDLYQMENY